MRGRFCLLAALSLLFFMGYSPAGAQTVPINDDSCMIRRLKNACEKCDGPTGKPAVPFSSRNCPSGSFGFPEAAHSRIVRGQQVLRRWQGFR